MTSTDFAAAQQRIAARREARQAAAQARATQQQNAIAASSLNRLPPSLRLVWTTLASQWSTISGHNGTRPAFRVGQVDAELLDAELASLLGNQVGEALKYYGPHLKDDWAAEIMLVLRSVLFKLTIWDHDASYGSALQNMRYSDARSTGAVYKPPSRWQKTLYGLFSVGGSYGWTRWENYLLDMESGYEEPSRRMRRLSKLTNVASTFHSVAALASFLIFLLNGRYRTLLDRLLRLRLTSTTNQVSRELSFEYLNRQLVWHAFTEFLLFLLPLVGIARWRRWLSRLWRRAKHVLRRKLSSGENDEDEEKPAGELGFLPERSCAICYQDQNPAMSSESDIAAASAISSGVIGSAATDITNPYEAVPCGDKYCYVCIAGRLEAEDGEGWACLRCGEMVRQCKPWNGDVLEVSLLSPSSTKSVKFVDKEKDENGFTALEPIPLDDVATTGRTLQNGSTALDDSEHWAAFDGDETAVEDDQAAAGAIVNSGFEKLEDENETREMVQNGTFDETTTDEEY